ncbi:MAG: hypothetical protein KAU17_02075 [Spirochaetales bacterium]|nr:hypothetical protein [Spirochaetales bacterium]
MDDKEKATEEYPHEEESMEEAEQEKSTLDTIFDLVHQLEDLRGTGVFAYLLIPMTLGRDLVEQTYELLEDGYKDTKDLDVLVTSGGGDIHSAYHLAKLFRRYAEGKLRFIVPRYAKSAATLLTFGGDEIVFGPVSELGPLDPQIALPPDDSERPMRRFSPLAIRPTLDLIAEENEKGHTILVEKLSSSLPEALILGQHLKELEVAKHYVTKLLTTRMLKRKKNAEEIAANIGKQLVSGYPSHDCCIDYDESVSLGLNISMAPADQWQIVWSIWKNAQKYMEEGSERERGASNSKHDILDVETSIC